MQQVICPKCKEQVDASLNFCPKCGSVLPLPNSYGSNRGATQVNQQNVAQAILNEGKKKQNPKVALAVGIITALVVIAVFIVLFATAETAVPTIADAKDNAVTLESSVSETSTEDSSSESSEMSTSESSVLAVESSEESSEAAPVANEIAVTAEKPDAWSDMYIYVYTSDLFKVADWPGEAMNDNGDGTYSYNIPAAFAEKDTYIVFSTTNLNDKSTAKQFPFMNDGGYSVKEKTNFTVSDFEAYAAEYKENNP